MARVLCCGWLAILSGVALGLPVGKAQLEGRPFTDVALAVLIASAGLIVVGAVALVKSSRQPRVSLPSGVRIAILANTMMVAFFMLELGDRLAAREGRLFYWSTFLLLPALALFAGLLLARPWAWWIARGVAAFAVVWFLGFVLLLPFADLQTEGVPVPWYGRIYMAGVSLFFAGVMAAAYRLLGQGETRAYFRRKLATPSAV